MFSGFRQSGRHPNGFHHACSIGWCSRIPCAVECCAVRRAGANDRQSERNIHGGVKADQFHRDVPLIMVHRHDPVKFTAHRPTNERVDRQRADHGFQRRCTCFHGWSDEARFFIAEQSVFSSMWIQCTHGNRAALAVNALQKIVHESNLANDRIRCDQLRNTLDGCVQRDVRDAESTQGAALSLRSVAGAKAVESVAAMQSVRIPADAASWQIQRRHSVPPESQCGRENDVRPDAAILY